MGIKNTAQQLWQRSMLHRTLLVAPPVALLVLFGFWKFGVRQPVQYYTAKVEKGDVAQVVQATGTINAVTTVQVGSQVSGIISEIKVDFNSRVKKGDVIAQIDPSILRTRLLQAQADLENAQANVKGLEAQIETQRADVLGAAASVDRARAQLAEADLNLTRNAQLANEGIVSASVLDSAKANRDSLAAGVRLAEAQAEQSKARLKSTQAQADQARAGVAQRRAAAEMARVDLGHTTIAAPIDGTVIARNVDVGQTVAASLSAPTLFIIAQDLTQMLVYAKTDEADVGKIRPGAVTTFRVDSFPREVFRGRVSQVRMNATTVQNVVTYDTIIEFNNPDQKLFPGMTAYVTIPVAWANNVVKVPNGALRFKPEITDEERKALYEKAGISIEEPRGRGMTASAGGGRNSSGSGAGQGRQGGGQGGSGGGQGGSGARQGGGNAGGGENSGSGDAPRRRPMGGQREEWGVVWKVDEKKQLTPIRVKLGVTDFTFTEMKEGTLEAGTELVIGQSSTRSTTAQQSGATPRPGAPMGGPGGMPRRF